MKRWHKYESRNVVSGASRNVVSGILERWRGIAAPMGPFLDFYIYVVNCGDLIVAEDEPIMQRNYNFHFPNWANSCVCKREFIFVAETSCYQRNYISAAALIAQKDCSLCYGICKQESLLQRWCAKWIRCSPASRVQSRPVPAPLVGSADND